MKLSAAWKAVTPSSFYGISSSSIAHSTQGSGDGSLPGGARRTRRGRLVSVDQVADLHLERPRESHDHTEARVLAPPLELGQIHAGDAGAAGERRLDHPPVLSKLPGDEVRTVNYANQASHQLVELFRADRA